MVLALQEIPEMSRSPEAIGLLHFCEVVHTSVVFLPVLAYLPEHDLSRCSLYWKKINTKINKLKRCSRTQTAIPCSGQQVRLQSDK